MIWTWYESSGREVPFPSYADVGYLGLPLLAAIGLLSLPSATQSLAGRIRTVIDGMMIAGAVLLCSWVLVLDKVYAAGGDGIVPTLISLAYPVGDVVLITMALYVLLRGRARSDRVFPMWMIVFGLSAFAVADSGFAYLGATGQYGSGSVIDIGWFVCFVAIMLAGLRPPMVVPDSRVELKDTGALRSCSRTSPVPSPSSRAPSRSCAPGKRTSSSHRPDVHHRGDGGAAGLTLSENRSLTRHLEERLAELHAGEQRFEALVQHSSDVVTVIDVDGSVLYQSESIERVFGFPVDAVSGNSIKMLLDEESARQLERLLGSRREPPGALDPERAGAVSRGCRRLIRKRGE